MANLNKPRKSASKRKGKVIVRQKVEVRSKSKESAKKDTIPHAPTKVPNNAATLRVKVKRK